jgi:pyruvate/2-oxoglutarate dehydrogenase complex dihydrolipoamide dehydrogenase (E3) component
MESFDMIVIGFGKAGKTVAAGLAGRGKRVALVERDKKMYGGTCINVACIPTKALNESAMRSALMGGSFEERSARYRDAIDAKRTLTSRLRAKNHAKVADAPGAEVIDGVASFLGPHEVRVTSTDGSLRDLTSPAILVNTGSRPNMPTEGGLSSSRRVFLSETMMELDELPRRLAIIGGGYIGVEFSSIFTNFGSKVTVIQHGETFLPREDQEVASSVLHSLEGRGVTLLRSTKVLSTTDGEDSTTLLLEGPEGTRELEVDTVLVATGRHPNLEDLDPSAAGIRLTDRGAILVDEHMRTNVPGIWAAGDVVGGLQFTYVSLDDSRIVMSDLVGDGSRTSANRGAVPYSVFVDPPFSRVGLTEEQALSAGRSVLTGRLAAAAIPKANVLGKTDGLLKVIIDADNDQILGAHLFCAESHELINTVKLAMDQGVPYTTLRDAIYTHPTMTEAFNDLFAQVM